jgi:hypothetical protein
MLIHRTFSSTVQDLCKMYYRFHELMTLLNPVIPYIMQDDFYYITCFQHIKMDHDMHTTLIKR